MRSLVWSVSSPPRSLGKTKQWSITGPHSLCPLISPRLIYSLLANRPIVWPAPAGPSSVPVSQIRQGNLIHPRAVMSLMVSSPHPQKFPLRNPKPSDYSRPNQPKAPGWWDSQGGPLRVTSQGCHWEKGTLPGQAADGGSSRGDIISSAAQRGGGHLSWSGSWQSWTTDPPPCHVHSPKQSGYWPLVMGEFS